MITVLKPGPVREDLHFDHSQFDGRRARAVSAETGIAHADYRAGMHVFQRKVQRFAGWIPQFAFNDEMLRRVLALAAWRYCNSGRQKEYMHLFVENLPALRQLADQRFRSSVARSLAKNLPQAQRRILQRHCYAVDAAGGWLHYHAAVAYFSWRVGMTSPKVAEQMGSLQAPGVRIILYRLTRIARELGLPTFTARAYQSRGKVRQAHVTKLPPGPKLVRLAAKPYWTPRRLAARYGVRTTSVQLAIRNAKQKRNFR
jgi:hypothetical protein